MSHDTPRPSGDPPPVPCRARRRPTPTSTITPPPSGEGSPPDDLRPDWDAVWADLRTRLAGAVAPDEPDPDPVAVGAALHRVGRVLARLDGPTPEPTPTRAAELPRTAGWKLTRAADVGGPNFDGPGAPLAAALLRAAVDELPPRLATLTAQLLADPRRRAAFAWLDTVGRLLAPWPDAGPVAVPAGGSARDAERLARLLRAPRIDRDPDLFPRWPVPGEDDPPPASDLIPYLPARVRAELDDVRAGLDRLPEYDHAIGANRELVDEFDHRDDHHVRLVLSIRADLARRMNWLGRLDEELNRRHYVEKPDLVTSKTAGCLLGVSDFGAHWLRLAAGGVDDRCKLFLAAAARARGVLGPGQPLTDAALGELEVTVREPVAPDLELDDEEPSPAPAAGADEYARFLELHALAESDEDHDVPPATLDEYQRLLTKYGCYTVEGIPVGPPDPTRVPRSEPILNTDCRPVPGATPRVCPRSSPRLPVEMLPDVERRFRELRIVGPGQTVLWVGRQARMETLCMNHRGCECFPDPPAAAARPARERPTRDPNRPGADRQNDIVATIRAAGTPLNRPELIRALRLKSEGKLGANLAWMVANGVLVSIPQQGYWPAADPPPE